MFYVLLFRLTVNTSTFFPRFSFKEEFIEAPTSEQCLLGSLIPIKRLEIYSKTLAQELSPAVHCCWFLIVLRHRQLVAGFYILQEQFSLRRCSCFSMTVSSIWVAWKQSWMRFPHPISSSAHIHLWCTAKVSAALAISIL